MTKFLYGNWVITPTKSQATCQLGPVTLKVYVGHSGTYWYMDTGFEEVVTTSLLVKDGIENAMLACERAWAHQYLRLRAAVSAASVRVELSNPS